VAAVSSIIAGAALAGSAVSGIAGANAQKKAAKSAANAQVQAADAATNLQRDIYNDQRDLYAPSAIAGASARARQMLMQGYSPAEVRQFLQSTGSAWAGTGEEAGMGGGNGPQGPQGPQGLLAQGAGLLNGAGEPIEFGGGNDAPTAAPNSSQYDWVDDWDWQSSSPSYQFRFDEGQRALERSAAARGDLYSGGTGRELTRYGQEFGSQEFENDFRRFGQIAGDGAAATDATATAAGNFGQQAANNTIRAGEARASGYANSGIAQSNMWSAVGRGIGGMYGLGQQSGWWGK